MELTPSPSPKQAPSCEVSERFDSPSRPENIELKDIINVIRVLSDSLPKDNDPVVKLLNSKTIKNKKEISIQGCLAY